LGVSTGFTGSGAGAGARGDVEITPRGDTVDEDEDVVGVEMGATLALYSR